MPGSPPYDIQRAAVLRIFSTAVTQKTIPKSTGEKMIGNLATVETRSTRRYTKYSSQIAEERAYFSVYTDHPLAACVRVTRRTIILFVGDRFYKAGARAAAAAGPLRNSAAESNDGQVFKNRRVY